MPSLIDAIARVRGSVTAVLRIHRSQGPRVEKGTAIPAQFEVAIVGTAWCFVANRYLLTAHHALNGGKPRELADRFYVFTVPANGPAAIQFPVTNILVEDPGLDLAVLEVGPSPQAGAQLPACAVTFGPKPDGSRVLTYGFPAPRIGAAQIDGNGDWIGGEFFLKAHANEGIVAARYEIQGVACYELNVGWHHGESGGPIVSVDGDAPAAFAVMQQYRNVESPHGIMAGPHMGRSLSAIERTLRELGAQVIRS